MKETEIIYPLCTDTAKARKFLRDNGFVQDDEPLPYTQPLTVKVRYYPPSTSKHPYGSTVATEHHSEEWEFEAELPSREWTTLPVWLDNEIQSHLESNHQLYTPFDL